MEQPFKSNDSLTGPMIGAVVAGLSVGFFGGWFSLALAGHGGNPWPFILLFGPVMVIAKAVPDSPSGAMVLIGACAGLFAVYFAVSTQLVWKPNPRARRLAILTLGMHVVCVGYALAFTPDLF